MTVSIIIINYNTFDLTSACIRSVIQYTKGVSYEIILVDNASTECEPKVFLEEFPQVKLIMEPHNGGFAYGNNRGIERSSGEYILLLNSDTVLREDSIRLTTDYAKRNAEAGVIGSRMTYPGGKVQYTARKFRSIGWELLDLFRFIPMLMPYKKRSRLMLGKYFQCDENVECDWVNGAFFFFSRKVLQQLPGGKLDERFFMYGEDQLWCEQIKKVGFKILFYAGTTIVHVGGASTDAKKQIALRKTMIKRELEIVRLRKGESVYYYVFSAIYVSKEGVRNLVKRIIYLFSGKVMK